jgi:hypothetical protein
LTTGQAGEGQSGGVQTERARPRARACVDSNRGGGRTCGSSPTAP